MPADVTELISVGKRLNWDSSGGGGLGLGLGSSNYGGSGISSGGGSASNITGMDFETEVGQCDPSDIACVARVTAKYGIPTLQATAPNPALAAAVNTANTANTANTVNTATTGGGNATLADIVNLPLTEEAKERLAQEKAAIERANIVWSALGALRVALDNQDQGIEAQRRLNTALDGINTAWENGEITWEQREEDIASEWQYYNQTVKNLGNATTALTTAQQTVQALGITRTEISDWDANYSPSNPISPRLGTEATFWEKAGDVGSDVLSAIAEATDWTGEALGDVMGMGDPDQFGPTIPNLGVGWQWGPTGKQKPVRIGTAKDGTPIIVYMPWGGVLAGGISGVQEGGTLGSVLGGVWEGVGGLGGILESTIKPTLAMTDDTTDTAATKVGVIDNSVLSGGDNTVGGEGIGELPVRDPSKVETFSDAPTAVRGLGALEQDPNITRDIDALMTDPNITRDIDALMTDPNIVANIDALMTDPNIAAGVKTNVQPDYTGSLSTLPSDPNKRAQVIIGEKPAHKWSMGELAGQPNYVANIDTLLTNPAHRAEMEIQGEPVIRADMTTLDGTATARGESSIWESPMQRAMVVLNQEAAAQGSLADDTLYTTTTEGKVADAQEVESLRGSAVNVGESPRLIGTMRETEVAPSLTGEFVMDVSSPVQQVSALKTSTLRGSSGGGGGGGGMGAPGGSGIGVGAGGPGDLVDIEYLFERFGDTIFTPRLTEEEEDDLLYAYT